MARCSDGTPRLVLGIDTSCDDTSVAVVTSDRRVLSNVVESQRDHEASGGIVPSVATQRHSGSPPCAPRGREQCTPACRAYRRAHGGSAALPRVVVRALAEAGVSMGDIHAVAATQARDHPAQIYPAAHQSVALLPGWRTRQGPGLPPCLAVGLNVAKALAGVCDKALVPVHHMVSRRTAPPLSPRTSARAISARTLARTAPAGGALADRAHDGRCGGCSLPLPVLAGKRRSHRASSG
jgi:N6-L-threonylcarbamoyladenine synthase